MLDVEPDWSALLKSAVDEPQTTVTVDDVATRVRQRRVRMRLAPVAACFAVAAVAVLAIVLSGTPATSHSGTYGHSGTNSDSPPPSVPAGLREWTFHGLAIDVPQAWPFNATRCGEPLRDTIMVPGVVDTCAAGRDPHITSVEFGGYGGYRRPLASAQSTETTVSGTAAKRTTGTRQGLYVIEVEVATLSASATITSPSLDEAKRLEATLHIVSVDSSGCPEHITRVPLDTVPAPDRNGADRALIPGAPSAVAFCRYASGYLEQAGVTGDPVAVVNTLNALPSGLSRTRGYYASSCGPDASSTEGLDLDATDYTIRATYRDGTELTVYARIGYCGDLGASNGARTGQRTDRLVSLLSANAGADSWPEYVQPAR